MITSVTNAKVKRVVQLNTKVKSRREMGEFVVEGLKMFNESPHEWIREIYVSESFYEKKENQNLLKGRLFEIVEDSVFLKMSDTMSPQGILCILSQPQYELTDFVKQENVFLLALEGIRDPGNLGTIFRAAEGAGVTGVIMTSETADLFNPKVIRATMGSIYRMPFFYTDTIIELLSQLKKEGFLIYAATLGGTKDYDQYSYLSKSVFLIGNEGNGLKEETVRIADEKIRIPMKGKVESLNAAMAAGILVYEAARQRREKK